MVKNKPGKNKKLSILFVTTNLNYNGAKKYIVEVANELATRGCRVGLLYDSGPLAKKLVKEVRQYHIDLKGLGLDSVSRWRLVIKAATLARNEDYTIIHSESANSFISHKLLSFLSRAKIVETIHHVWSSDQERRKAAAKISGRADKIITISTSALKVLASFGLKKRKIVVIQNGINTKEYEKINKNEVEVLRKNLGISKKDRVIISVSRVSRAKNFEAFVNWFPYILSSFPSAKLVIVGDNGSGDRGYLDGLIKKIRSLNLHKNIICVGGKTFVKNYLGLAEIYTVTTVARGLAVLEAMSSGLPVVARKPLMPVKIETTINGKTGLVFGKGDYKNWAGHIKYLLSNPTVARKMGEEGRKRASDFFTVQKHVDQLEKLYQRLKT